MKLSPQEVEDIAELARLNITEEEKEQYAKELSVVLDYIEKLQEVETEGVEPTSQVTGLENITREDQVRPISEEDKEKIIEEFPQKEGRLLKVKEVFENRSN